VDDDSTPRLPPREEMIVDMVSHVVGVLQRAPTSTHVRELLAQAQFYEKAVRRWNTVPPTTPQLEAMLDLVTALHEEAKRAKGRREEPGA
jgi:hypothetical protein